MEVQNAQQHSEETMLLLLCVIVTHLAKECKSVNRIAERLVLFYGMVHWIVIALFATWRQPLAALPLRSYDSYTAMELRIATLHQGS